MNKFIIASILALLPATAHALDFPDRGRRAVVDAANVIPDDQEAILNSKIVDWVHRTHPPSACRGDGPQSTGRCRL